MSTKDRMRKDNPEELISDLHDEYDPATIAVLERFLSSDRPKKYDRRLMTEGKPDKAMVGIHRRR